MSRVYQDIVQVYFALSARKRELIKEQERICAKLSVIDDVLTDLDNVLSVRGKHYFENFEELDPDKSEREEGK